MERKITQVEIEREALRREQDPASKERLAKIEKELADLKEKSAALKAHWQKEKEVITRIQAVKEQIEKAKIERPRPSGWGIWPGRPKSHTAPCST